MSDRAVLLDVLLSLIESDDVRSCICAVVENHSEVLVVSYAPSTRVVADLKPCVGLSPLPFDHAAIDAVPNIPETVQLPLQGRELGLSVLSSTLCQQNTDVVVMVQATEKLPDDSKPLQTLIKDEKARQAEIEKVLSIFKMSPLNGLKRTLSASRGSVEEVAMFRWLFDAFRDPFVVLKRSQCVDKDWQAMANWIGSGCLFAASHDSAMRIAASLVNAGDEGKRLLSYSVAVHVAQTWKDAPDDPSESPQNIHKVGLRPRQAKCIDSISRTLCHDVSQWIKNACAFTRFQRIGALFTAHPGFLSLPIGEVSYLAKHTSVLQKILEMYPSVSELLRCHMPRPSRPIPGTLTTNAVFATSCIYCRASGEEHALFPPMCNRCMDVHLGVRIGPSDLPGGGNELFATRPLFGGSTIFTFEGEYVTKEDLSSRCGGILSEMAMSVSEDESLWIDPSKFRGVLSFMNHAAAHESAANCRSILVGSTVRIIVCPDVDVVVPGTPLRYSYSPDVSFSPSVRRARSDVSVAPPQKLARLSDEHFAASGLSSHITGGLSVASDDRRFGALRVIGGRRNISSQAVGSSTSGNTARTQSVCMGVGGIPVEVVTQNPPPTKGPVPSQTDLCPSASDGTSVSVSTPCLDDVVDECIRVLIVASNAKSSKTQRATRHGLLAQFDASAMAFSTLSSLQKDDILQTLSTKGIIICHKQDKDVLFIQSEAIRAAQEKPQSPGQAQ